MSTISPITPPSHVKQLKVGSVARTDTTAFVVMKLPKNAVITNVTLFTATASDAGTSADVDVGTSSTATELVNSQDVKTAAGFIQPSTVMKGLVDQYDADVSIYAKYVESGIASTTGGPWDIMVEYFTTGPGEKV